MSSEVNQAAERLRRNEYPASLAGDDQWAKDRGAVIAAYLAEHLPDDDEPITREWLESEGYRCIEGDYEIRKCKNGSNAIVRMTNPPSVFLSSFWLRITTRGQLRQLLKALQ